MIRVGLTNGDELNLDADTYKVDADTGILEVSNSSLIIGTVNNGQWAWVLYNP